MKAQPRTGSVVIPKGRDSAKTMRKKLPDGASVAPKSIMTSKAAPAGKAKDMTSAPGKRGPRDT